jgi:hypothetical protein
LSKLFKASSAYLGQFLIDGAYVKVAGIEGRISLTRVRRPAVSLVSARENAGPTPGQENFLTRVNGEGRSVITKSLV